MGKKTSTIPFSGTPEQEAELRKIIAAHKGDKGALMPVLQQAQGVYGYLPIEVQEIINPKGQYKIAVCLGTACYVKGSGDIFNKLSEVLGIKGGETTPDGKFTLVDCRCIGACGLAPVLTVNDDVYGRLTVDDVADILAK